MSVERERERDSPGSEREKGERDEGNEVFGVKAFVCKL